MKYRSKSEIVDAFQWDSTYGQLEEHFGPDAESFYFQLGYDPEFYTLIDIANDMGEELTDNQEFDEIWSNYFGNFVQIKAGDYIVSNENGILGVPTDIFEETYEKVE